MSWKGTELVIRIVGDLKRYRETLREAGRETQQAMATAKASTDGLTAAQRGLESQAGRTAGQLVDAGRAAASGDFARAGAQVAGMAGSMESAAIGAGALGMAVGGVLSAVGAYLLISYKAAAEHERQANLMALTGNAAGLLAGDMNRMASSVAEAGNTTVSSAREITESLVATGKVGKPALESLGTAIALVARASGDTEQQVTGDFARMADGVAKWAAEHNEQYHFLTLEQYRYIKALEDAGNQQQAMKVVGDAFISHLQDIDDNVGYLQGAWRSLGQAASRAWDAMLGWGRADTLTDKIAAAEKRVAQLSATPVQGGGWGAAQGRKNLAEAQADLEALRETARLERRAADAKAERAAATQAAIDKEIEDEKAKRKNHAATDKLTAAEKALREDLDREGKFRQVVIDKEREWAEEAQKAARDAAEVEAFFRQQEINAEQRWDNERQDAADKIRKDELKAWEKTWDQVSQSFTDALMEGGRSVKDYLEGLFRTLVLRPVLAPVGAALASAVTPSMAGSGGSFGLSDAVGMLGQVAGISGALGTGIAAGFTNALAGTFAGSLTAAGSLIGTGTVAGVTSGVGMAIGTVAPYALAAIAIYKALTAETPGEQHTGGFYSTAGRSGFDAAAAVTGSRGGETRDLIDRNNPEIQRAVAKGADALVSSVTAMASSLGRDMALALDVGFAANTNGSAKNKNAFGYFGVSLDGQMVRTSQNRNMGEDAGAAFEQLMKDAGAAMAELVLAGTDYARDGETALDTLTRLSSALQGVNQVFDTLGLRAYQVSLASGDMASSLADLFGGLQGFASASAAYYQAFYSEDERAATTRRQLSTALGALGYQLPGTRDGFRALVEAQDLTTDSGRRTYATLLGLAPAFAELTQAMEAAGDSVADEIERLRGLATGGTAQGYAALQARFATTTAAARAGSASALEELPSISRAMEEAAALQATSAAELALIRQQIAASLQATLGGLGLQVPALATGTNLVPHDMLVMAHKGEAVVPAAYNPAANGGGMGGSAVLDELRAVREVLARVLADQDAALVAVAAQTAKVARVLERAQPTGDALLVMTQAEFDAL